MNIDLSNKKIAIAADLHLNVTTYGKVMDDGLPLKIHDAFMALDFVVDTCIDRDIGYLFVVGDTFEHPAPTSKVRELLDKRLQKLVDNGILVTLLTGNHDCCLEHHALGPLKGWNEKLRIVDKLGVEQAGGVRIAYVPHTMKVEKRDASFKEYIKELQKTLAKKDKRTIVLGHFPVCGGYQNDNSTNWDDRNVLASELELLNCEACFLGDFHKRQKLSKTKEIHYVGSTERINFGEKDQEKGFCIYDLATKEIEWLDYSARPMIEIAGVDYDEVIERVEEASLDDAIVKVRITGTEDDYAHVQQRFREIASLVISGGAVYFAGLERPKIEVVAQTAQGDGEEAQDSTDGADIFDLVKDEISTAASDEDEVTPDESEARIALLSEVEKQVAIERQVSSNVSLDGKKTIKFKRLKLHNFCRFGEENNVIDFDSLFSDDDGEYAGIASITGATDGNDQESNGAGKSTVLEGIAYVLYERLPRLSVGKDPNKARDRSKRATTEIIRTHDNGEYACREAYVELCMEVDGCEWIIKRGRKLSKNLQNHSSILEISKDGKPFNSRKKKEPDQVILDLVGIDYEPFCNSVFFAQKDISKIFVSTPKAKMDAILNVLGVLGDINEALEIVRAKKKENKLKISTLEGKTSVLSDVTQADDGEIENRIKSRIESLEKSVKDSEKDYSSGEKELAALMDEKTTILGEISTKTEQQKSARDELDNIGSKHSNEEQRYLSTKQQLEKRIGQERRIEADFEKSKNELKEEYTEQMLILKGIDVDALNLDLEKVAEAKNDIKKETEKRDALVKERSKIVQDRGEKDSDLKHASKAKRDYESSLANADGDVVYCPHCGSTPTVAKVKELIKEESDKEAAALSIIKNISKKIESANVEIAKVDAEVDSLDAIVRTEVQTTLSIHKHKAATEAIKAIKERAASLKDGYEKIEKESIVELQDAISEIEKKIAEMKQKISDEGRDLLNKANNLQVEIRGMREQVRKIEEAARAQNGAMVEARRNKERLISDLRSKKDELIQLMKYSKDLKQAQEELENERKNQLRILLLETHFGSDGVKSKLVQRYLPVFNRHLDDFISILTDGKMSVRLVEGTMESKITGGSASIYEMLSGGEQDIVRLAANLALGMVSLGSSKSLPETLFLDEVFGSLAPAPRERVFLLLNHLRSYFRRLLVITHSPPLQVMFNLNLRVDKRNGISTVSIIS